MFCRTLAEEEPDIASIAVRPGMVDTEVCPLVLDQTSLTERGLTIIRCKRLSEPPEALTWLRRTTKFLFRPMQRANSSNLKIAVMSLRLWPYMGAGHCQGSFLAGTLKNVNPIEESSGIAKTVNLGTKACLSCLKLRMALIALNDVR